MTQAPTLHYLFDPLCGWCYASAPALQGLAAAHPGQLNLMPSGLFSEGGGRALTPEWAQYAWTNDQRIAAMTGQVFSEAYHQQVLLGAGVRFDSTMMNRVLTATRSVEPTLEAGLLHALQLARYVDGRDTARADVVAELGAAYAGQHGHAWDAAALAERLQSDQELIRETDARTREAQGLMHELGIRGVPQLVLRNGNDVSVISGAALYQGTDMLLAEVERRSRVGKR